MKMYIIVVIAVDDKTMSIEPLGVFSSMKKALKHIKKLEELTIQNDEEEIMYDVVEYNLDEEPPFINWLKEQKEKNDKEIEKAVVDLMKKGMIDQLIGEDGNFYYTLTDLGEKAMNQGGVVNNFKKFFKKDM